MSRLTQPVEGTPINNPPTGFPLFVERRRPRIVTADIWAFFRHMATSKLPQGEQRQALAFIEQAFEFCEAASNPRLGSRPLLYYYSFLNLAKMFLLIRKVRLAVAPKHGISDPKANEKKRLRLEGQAVRMVKCARNHSELFPEFVKALGKTVSEPANVKVIDLLSQIPAIHRTFCKVVGAKPAFLPVARFHLLKHKNHIHVRMVIKRNDDDVKKTLSSIRKSTAFSKLFTQVSVPQEHADQIWFDDMEGVRGVKRGVDTAIKTLAKRVREIGVWSILTTTGYRFYLANLPAAKVLPGLASTYAVMFYLGSITRYKPYDFDSLFAGKYSWLISEFLRTSPMQFLYGLAGHIAGVDVVRPFAAIDK